MRIDKYISGCGYASRKDVKKLIKQGLVFIDGEVCKKPEEQTDENSIVEVDGERLIYREFVYLMLNKPQGCVSAVYDKKYPVVTEFVPEEYAHFEVYPVGRLDIDTEGLLILTNDGQFAHEMTSPKKDVYKRYFAVLDKPMEEKDVEIFAGGMEFKEFTAKSAKLEITENPNEVYIEIAEGKFHQVKRMCERVGKTVTYLKRVAIGNLKLDKSLEKGEVRELTKDELDMLYKK
ncbi:MULTISPECIES: pseudouridine synthase [Hominilimicola]|jgi:16S rRNA pseudouridine516 synthase|uniref:Pseudouridine synthase n=1 Tax=Hominilimicola fabiformis TaxID=2885356 RepID=A0AAE3JA94_9FIRM|nr:pseudouridine synthase [Hominilimicola fabiformis]MBP6243306.1 rRNA pseudouridine synthase [Clostridia bacterium]MBS5303758.1 rRNA pseudouridine synthase [Bacillota bacterium]MCC2210535.1 rRNA pseudouridine synthase [Hominilimicola fabiformis]MDR4079767.1 pseudouridine synthase [Clostridia bacterium]